MAALEPCAPLWDGDEALLRLRFFRAPPAEISASATSTIRFVVSLSDEHGADAALDDACDVTCDIGGAPLEPRAVDAARARWSFACPAALFVRGSRGGSCRVVARAARATPPLRDLDVLGAAALVAVVDGAASSTPQFACERCFEFRGVAAAVTEDFGAACGSHVWNGGVALAAYAAAHLPSGARVLELGAGCGLVAAVAAARGASVVSTDRGHALPALERNAAAARAASGRPDPTTAALDFADPAAVSALAAASSFDRVLAADLLYDRSAARALPGALVTLVEAASVAEVWLAHTRRDATTDALDGVLTALRGAFPRQAVVARIRNVSIHVLRTAAA